MHSKIKEQKNGESDRLQRYRYENKNITGDKW